MQRHAPPKAKIADGSATCRSTIPQRTYPRRHPRSGLLVSAIRPPFGPRALDRVAKKHYGKRIHQEMGCHENRAMAGGSQSRTGQY